MDVVTGAFGFTGKYIAGRLLAAARDVRTLTGHPGRPNPFGERLSVAPLNFADYAGLVASLHGAHTLYNTYWIRFPHGEVDFATAVANSKVLLRAAVEAGARRLVHVSVVNAAPDSPLPYFRGKAAVEAAIRESGLSYAIVRPTLIFGPEDILVNNIAWLLRHFPLFAIPGRGDYLLQPVFVEDVAALAVSLGARGDDVVVDAVGPEVYTYERMLRLIAAGVRSRALLLHVSPPLALALARRLGVLLGDVLLTRDELEGLMASLLVSHAPPTGATRLSDWLEQHANGLGLTYVSGLRRHYR